MMRLAVCVGLIAILQSVVDESHEIGELAHLHFALAKNASVDFLNL